MLDNVVGMIIDENQLLAAHNILNTTKFEKQQSNNPSLNNRPKWLLLKC